MASNAMNMLVLSCTNAGLVIIYQRSWGCQPWCLNHGMALLVHGIAAGVTCCRISGFIEHPAHRFVSDWDALFTSTQAAESWPSECSASCSC